MDHRIVGISGTNGSGKDTLGEILRDGFGWYFVSVTDLLRAEVAHRGLPIERQNTRLVSTEWRKKFGVAVLMDKAIEDYKKQTEPFNGLIIANLRNPGEADRIHELGGQVVWVDADPELRYQRVTSRARSAEDKKTFEQFMAEEQEEMHGTDKHGLNMSAVKAKADLFLTNNSNDLDGFKSQIKKVLVL